MSSTGEIFCEVHMVDLDGEARGSRESTAGPEAGSDGDQVASDASHRSLTPRDTLPIGEVARRSGYAASALRYYEAEGLIAADRNASGRRVYSRHVLRRLAFIRAAQSVGLPLQQVARALADLPADRAPTKADWQQISRDWQQMLAERITALQQLQTTLTSCIGCGCLSLTACALYNPDDALAADGDLPGARKWSPVLRQGG